MIKQQHGLILQSTGTSMSVRTIHTDTAKGNLREKFKKKTDNNNYFTLHGIQSR